MAISIGIGNYISRGLIRGGGIKPTFPEGLIARYACYDKTNEDEDRDVLKDLSGNGHDIQLYNFAFTRESGYGSWDFNFKSSSMESIGISKGVARNITYDSCEYKPFKNDDNRNLGRGVYISCNALVSTTLVCEGILPDNNVYIVPYNRTLEQQGIQKIKLSNGINKVNFELKDTRYTYIIFVSDKGYNDTFVKFKIIPDYKGALVSDGVDDYGLCENFPILNKNRGYTIFAIRKILSDKGCFVSNRTHSNYGAFSMEVNIGSWDTRSFTDGKSLTGFIPSDLFTYQKSKEYNGQNLTYTGQVEYGNNELCLFSIIQKYHGQWTANTALYVLEIYDRDLTDEEIAKVKARMIAEYEAKTGESIEPYLKLDQGKLDINKLK